MKTVICLICTEDISATTLIIACPSCSSNYHVGHLEQWTELGWRCLSCHHHLKDLFNQIPVALELHSNHISVGFVGEDQPRANFPFAIGKPRYTHFDYHGDDFAFVIKHLYEGYFGEEIEALRGVLKVISITSKGMIIHPPYFLQLLHYCFFRVLNIDPMNHPIIVANSVSTKQEQRDLLRDLLFDVFGFPRVFMSSHHYFGIIGTGNVSGLSIELDQDMMIVVPVHEGKILHRVLRMEMLSEGELRQYKEDLRVEARDVSIIQKIMFYLKETLNEMDSHFRHQVCRVLLIYDLDNLVRNQEKLTLRLQSLLKDIQISETKTIVVGKGHKFVAWKGINFFYDQRMHNYEWTVNEMFEELGRKYLDSPQTDDSILRARADEIIKSQDEGETKHYIQMHSDDIESALYINDIYTLVIDPAYPSDFGKLIKLADHPKINHIRIRQGNQDSRSHPFSKVEYLWLLKLRAFPYFSEKGLDLIMYQR